MASWSQHLLTSTPLHFRSSIAALPMVSDDNAHAITYPIKLYESVGLTTMLRFLDSRPSVVVLAPTSRPAHFCGDRHGEVLFSSQSAKKNTTYYVKDVTKTWPAEWNKQFDLVY